MMMEDVHRYRRLNASGELARRVSDTCFAAAFVFWGWVHWGIVQPQFTAAGSGYTTESMIAGVVLALVVGMLALCNAVVQPFLLAALFPSTVAAQYLQEIRRATWGFWLMVAANAVVSGFTLYILLQFWTARIVAPLVTPALPWAAVWASQKTLVWGYVALTFTFFAVVPAWLTNYGSGVLWMTEVQQSHEVQVLKLQHQSELTLMETQFYGAKEALALSLANDLMGRADVAADVLQALFLSQNDSLARISHRIDTMTNTKGALPLLDDSQVVSALQQVRQAVAQQGTVVDVPATSALVPAPASGAATSAPVPMPTTSSSPRSYAAEYAAARATFDGIFTPMQLGAAVGGKSDRTARGWLQAWEGEGLVARGESKGNWYFTDGRRG